MSANAAETGADGAAPATPERLSPPEVEALEPPTEPPPASSDPPVGRAENPGGFDTDHDRLRVWALQRDAALGAVRDAERRLTNRQRTVREAAQELTAAGTNLADAEDALVAVRRNLDLVRADEPTRTPRAGPPGQHA